MSKENTGDVRGPETAIRLYTDMSSIKGIKVIIIMDMSSTLIPVQWSALY